MRGQLLYKETYISTVREKNVSAMISLQPYKSPFLKNINLIFAHSKPYQISRQLHSLILEIIERYLENHLIIGLKSLTLDFLCVILPKIQR
jgi:hypothetical protein